jgi:hypothetical protein
LAKSFFLDALRRHCKADFCKLLSAVVNTSIRLEMSVSDYSGESLLRLELLLKSSVYEHSFP